MEDSVRDLIISLYNQGFYPISIRSQTGVSLTHIYRTLHKNNVALRDPSVSHRDHQMDFSFFERIDSHEKAQVLGFIASDGCVDKQSIRIGLANVDHEYLEWIKATIGYIGDIRVYAPRSANRQATSWLNLYSEKMVTDITRLGCTPRKSLTLQFPTEEQVPSEFVSSFMLGYFEGDGSLSSFVRKTRPSNPEYNFTICGTQQFCYRYGEIMNITPKIDVRRCKCQGEIYQFRIHGNRQIKRAMDFLYSHATYTLARKRIQYDRLCAQLTALDAKRSKSAVP